MADATNLMGRLLLFSSSRFSAIRRVPLLGDLVHRLSHRLVPSGKPLWVQIRAGAAEELWLELHPRTARDYYEGRAEPEVQQVLQQYLRPGMVFYDIGANIGFFAFIAARLVGKDGRVFAFEPEPELVTRIKRHIQRNGLTSVSVVEAGVWSTTGMATLIRSDPALSPERGTGSLSVTAGSGDSFCVASIALDDFLQGAPPPHLIKCDAEGAEVEVFRGAARLLTRHKPAIVCEIHSRANLQSLRDLLPGYGYRITELSENHILAVHCDPWEVFRTES